MSQGRPTFVVPSFFSTFSVPIPSIASFSAFAASGLTGSHHLSLAVIVISCATLPISCCPPPAVHCWSWVFTHPHKIGKPDCGWQIRGLDRIPVHQRHSDGTRAAATF